MKTSRSRRVAIAAITLIIVIGAGGLLIHSLSSTGKNNGAHSFTNSWSGRWRGTIIQPDSAVHSWTFTMSLNETNGKFVGTYVESSLACSGTLTLTFADSSELELNEAVTTQPPTGTPWFCGGGPIQIKRTGRDSAVYRWEGGVAHGIIRRRRGR